MKQERWELSLKHVLIKLLLSILLFVAASGQSEAIETYQFATQWGGTGSGNGKFNGARGIAVDPSGNVYVADVGNYLIQKFDSSGVYLTQWGTYGFSNGQISGYLDGVVVDPIANSGNPVTYNVYTVEDSYSLIYDGRVQKFDSNGTYITQWGPIEYGTGSGQFRSPTGIAVDQSRDIYVTDCDFAGGRVQKFDGSGGFLTQWITYSTTYGVAVDASGNVYVLDDFYNLIQKFDPGGVLLTNWGSSGSGNGQFNNPFAIAVDITGNVYVADCGNDRIQKFGPNGVYLTQWGSPGSGSGQFSCPKGVAVDLAGNVYVVDTNRVQKFAPTQIPTITIQGVAGDSTGSITGGHTLDCSVTADGSASGACAEADSQSASLVLTATPAPGAYVTWGGCTSSSGNTCNVTLYDDTVISVHFSLSQNYQLTVNKTGPGMGTVTSNPPGINCETFCSSSWAKFQVDQVVMLSATPETGGSIFSGWTGAPDCSDGDVVMGANKSCTAAFSLCGSASIAMTGSSALFGSITAAYLAAGSTDAIKIIGSTQNEGDIAFNGKNLTVQGGYDCAFSEPPTSLTTITGSLTISGGSVSLSGIAIR